MKLIHTSDWHLGHSLKGKSRHLEHQQFLDWLIAQVMAHHVDCVIVAGDIFDTTSPSSRARELYQGFIAKLYQTQCQLIVLGGNHDSVAVLNESKVIASELNTYVIPSTGMALNDQVITVHDTKGKAIAVVCAVPFIRANDVLKSEAGQSDGDKKQQMGEAIAQHYANVYDIALQQQSAIKEKSQNTVPIIATGHLTAVGATLSESVREIYIGTLEAFSIKGFPAADYIALGHIHKPQIVGKQTHIRYCGSPIPLSFDETRYQKQINLVTFDDNSTTPQITEIDVPLFQQLVSLKGDLASISSQIDELKHSVEQASVWLNVEVQKQAYLADLNQQIQDMLSGSNIELLVVKRIAADSVSLEQSAPNETLEDLNPTLVFDKLLQNQGISPDDEHHQVLKDLFNRIKNEVETQRTQLEDIDLKNHQDIEHKT